MNKGWLLDTSVISAFAPGKPAVAAGVSEWMLAQSSQLYIPCIAVMEIEQGICKLKRVGGGKRADALGRWLDGLIKNYGERLLPFDIAASRSAGKIADDAMSAGQHPGFADVAITAIAQQAKLTVLTCNLKHFLPLDCPCADPFVELPD